MQSFFLLPKKRLLGIFLIFLSGLLYFFTLIEKPNIVKTEVPSIVISTPPTIKINPNKVKIYVVNIDKNKERWNLVHSLLDDLGLKHERFRATDGVNLSVIDLKTNQKINLSDVKKGNKKIEIGKQYLVGCEGYNQLIQFGYNQSMKNLQEISEWNQKSIPGIIGHYCTHIRILNQIFNKDEIAIVLDDDTSTNYDKEEFLESYYKVLSNMPEDWQMLFWFHATHSSRSLFYPFYKKYLLTGLNIVEPYPASVIEEPRAPLYMINKQGAQAMLLGSQKLYHAYDAVMGRIAISGAIKSYFVTATKEYILCSQDIKENGCLDEIPKFSNRMLLPLEFSGRANRKDIAEASKTNVWH